MGEEKIKGQTENKSVFEYANELVGATNPEDSGIIFLPFLFGNNVDADAKACFVGLSCWHKKAQVLRALYEGVVFCHKAHIDKLLVYRDNPKAIRIAGGAARSKEWVQIFADALQIPIEVTTGTELGALGAAICAGIATGDFKSFQSAADSMVNVAYTCFPNTDNKAIYEKKYELYQETVKALTPIWKKL
jgi:L-xylulokinase